MSQFIPDKSEGVTVLVSSTDGTTYLRTQHGNSSAEIADSLRPYVGRTVSCDLPNMYGHYKRYQATLRAVGKDTATVYVARLDYETTIDAFDAFGTHCTTIEKG